MGAGGPGWAWPGGGGPRRGSSFIVCVASGKHQTPLSPDCQTNGPPCAQVERTVPSRGMDSRTPGRGWTLPQGSRATSWASWASRGRPPAGRGLRSIWQGDPQGAAAQGQTEEVGARGGGILGDPPPQDARPPICLHLHHRPLKPTGGQVPDGFPNNVLTWQKLKVGSPFSISQVLGVFFEILLNHEILTAGLPPTTGTGEGDRGWGGAALPRVMGLRLAPHQRVQEAGASACWSLMSRQEGTPTLRWG